MEPEEHATTPLGAFDRLEVNADSQRFLYKAAKWSRLLAVIGFLFVMFLVLLAAFVSVVVSFLKRYHPGIQHVPSGAIALFYFLLAILYLFPSVFLFQFSSNMLGAIKYNSSVQLARAFSKLKSYFKFYGIMALILIIFYVLVVVFGIAGGIHAINRMQP